MENDYSVEIIEGSREFSKRERIGLKQSSNGVSLDEATKNGAYTFQPVDYAVLHVHNVDAENTDYNRYVIIGADEKNYITGSQTFWRSFKEIWNEMDGEEFEIEVTRSESKNYKGKYFLNCSIV